MDSLNLLDLGMLSLSEPGSLYLPAVQSAGMVCRLPSRGGYPTTPSVNWYLPLVHLCIHLGIHLGSQSVSQSLPPVGNTLVNFNLLLSRIIYRYPFMGTREEKKGAPSRICRVPLLSLLLCMYRQTTMQPEVSALSRRYYPPPPHLSLSPPTGA